MSSYRKFRNRVLTVLITLVLIIIGALSIAFFFFGDSIKESLLSHLNSQMEIEVAVEKIELDLFTQFPKGSLRLTGIQSRENGSSAEKSLLRAGEIDLLFDITDILLKKYSIDKIKLQDAFLNLTVHEDGEVNYRILKPSGEKGSSLNVQLRKVQFKNVVVSFIHSPAQQEYLFRIDEGTLAGTFSSKLQEFNFEGIVQSTHIKSGENTFLANRKLALNTQIEIDRDKHMVRFNKGDIQFEGMDFSVTGDVISSNVNKDLNLSIQLQRSPVRSLIKLIPDAYLKPLEEITLDADLDMEAIIKGTFAGSHIPRVDISFNLENGSLVHSGSKLKLSSIQAGGLFTNGAKSAEATYRLTINRFKSSFEGGNIEGTVDIENFNHPRVTTQIISRARLQDIQPLFRIDTLDQIQGVMELNLEFTNRLKNFRKFTINDFISSKTSGNLKVSGMQFTLKDSPLEFTDFNGDFRFNNKDLKIERFSGNISGSDFSMQGYFRNILAFAFMPDESIYISADFHSQRLSLDDILVSGNDQEGKNELRFSEQIYYDLNMKVDTFMFRKFTSTHNAGRLVQENKILSVKDMRLHSMEGDIIMNGSIDGRNNRLYTINCNADFKGVNITKLFRDFGEFGQQNITSDHLRGTVDANVNYRSTITPFLYVDQKSVYTLADVVITNGELVQYAPLQKLSGYTKKGQLDHVRFSVLKNQIVIKDEIVYIPQMDIESSSMNLSLSGEHSFDNEIDYHVQLLLSEVISGREPDKEDLGSDFTTDDGLGRTRLFLSMTGSAEDPVIKYDTRKVVDKVSADLKKEKSELKKVFQSEFSRNDNKKNSEDTLIIQSGSSPAFSIGWDETQKKNTDEVPDQPKAKDKKKKNPAGQDFIIKWDEKKDTVPDRQP